MEAVIPDDFLLPVGLCEHLGEGRLGQLDGMSFVVHHEELEGLLVGELLVVAGREHTIRCLYLTCLLFLEFLFKGLDIVHLEEKTVSEEPER